MTQSQPFTLRCTPHTNCVLPVWLSLWRGAFGRWVCRELWCPSPRRAGRWEGQLWNPQSWGWCAGFWKWRGNAWGPSPTWSSRCSPYCLLHLQTHTDSNVKMEGDTIQKAVCFSSCSSSPVLPGRILVWRFFLSQSGLMASISSTEDARRMLWKLSRERLWLREQLELEASWFKLRRWWGATQGDDWATGPRWDLWGAGWGRKGGSGPSKVCWSSWRSSGQLCRADLGNRKGHHAY